MNTTTIAQPSTPLEPTRPNRAFSRFSRLSRVLLAAVCTSLVSFATVPAAQAAKVNGSYDVKLVRGALEYDGKKLDIPDRYFKEIVRVKRGKIVVSNRKLRIDKKATIDIVEKYSNRFVDVDTSVTGPAYVKFDKVDDMYIGKGASKIISKFDADILVKDFSGVLKTKVTAKVNRKTLKIILRYYGESEGSDFSGRVVIIAKR